MEKKSWQVDSVYAFVSSKMSMFFELVCVLISVALIITSCSGINDLFVDDETHNDDKDTTNNTVVLIPDALKLMLGRGYDVTGRYAASSEIKSPVLDLPKLTKDGLVKRDPNYRTATYETISGYRIDDYQNSLATKVTSTAKAGVEGVGSFSTEIGASFGMDKARNSEYGFATSTSRIVRDAYVIDYRTDPDKLFAYVSAQFDEDSSIMTPEQLINSYGTHVMFGGVLGARLDYNMCIKVLEESSSYSIGAYAAAMAEATVEGVTAGGGTTASVDTQFSEYLETSSKEVKTTVVGGDPEKAQSVQNKQSYDAWINSIEGNEVWSDYYPNSLVPISELIRDTTKKKEVEEFYEAYFKDKKINVITDTHDDTVSATAVLVSGSRYVKNDGTGDMDVATGEGSITDWSLKVEPQKRSSDDGRNIDVKFTYTVTERYGDQTKLILEYTHPFDVNKNIVSIDSPSSWTISGTCNGSQMGLIPIIDDTGKVLVNNAKSPILSNTSIRVDGDGSDEGNICVNTDITVNYTYQGQEE